MTTYESVVLSYEEQVLINDKCDEFEIQIRSDAQPQIEQFLADCPDHGIAFRRAFFAALLEREISCLGPGAPSLFRYELRFPEFLSTVKDIFQCADSKHKRWLVGDWVSDPATHRRRWRVLGIHRGGMGLVYVLQDVELNEVLAAKTFDYESIGSHAKLRARFEIESRSWIRISHHENVVRALLFETMDGHPVLFMEYVTGGDLRSWIDTPRLKNNLDQVLLFAIQFCDGILHAYSQGISAHRDVKPENCLITDANVLKVSDFGASKAVNELTNSEWDNGSTSGSFNMTTAGAVLGTLPYMAPEQFEDPRRVGASADVYSFGVMLFEMTTGRRPFSEQSGCRRTYLEAYRSQHQNEAPQHLPAGDAALKRLDELIQACLEKSPEQRPTFNEVLQELESLFFTRTQRKRPLAATGVALDVADLCNQGRSLHKLGQKQSALSCFDKAVAKDPENSLPWLFRGSALNDQRDFREACACLDHAIRLNPLDPQGYVNKGFALQALDMNDQALELYDFALNLHPHCEVAYFNKANALRRRGDLDEAHECLEHCLLLNPRYAEAWNNKGYSLARQGAIVEALECYDRAIEIHPFHAEALSNRGAALIDLGRYREGVDACEEAIELNSSSSTAWSTRGAGLWQLGEHKESIRSLERALELDADNRDAQHNLNVALRSLQDNEPYENDPVNQRRALSYLQAARSLAAGGRVAEALNCLDLALAEDLKFVPVWSFKSRLLEQMNRISESRACMAHAVAENGQNAVASLIEETQLLRCVEEQPTVGDDWLLRGVVHAWHGNHEQALVAFKEAAAMGSHALVAWVNIANIYQQQGNLSDCIDYCKMVLNREPDHVDALILRGTVMCDQLNDPAGALPLFQRAVHCDPRNVHAWHNKGVALLLMERWQQALTCFDHAIALDEYHSHAWYNKGVAHANLGELDSALASFYRAKELGRADASDAIDWCRQHMP